MEDGGLPRLTGEKRELPRENPAPLPKDHLFFDVFVRR